MALFRNPGTGRFVSAPSSPRGGVGPLGWRPNPKLDAELAASPEMVSELRTVAAGVARVAETNIRQITRQGFMPRGGDLVVVEEGHDGSVIVLNTDHGGHLYEWGSINTPAYAPMRRAVRAVGLKFAAGGTTARPSYRR